MIDILETAVRKAGSITLSYFRKESHISRKTSHQNLVTVADVESQEAIKQSIIHSLALQDIPPEEIGFIGEERLETKGKKTLLHY